VLAGDVPARITSTAVAMIATKNEIWCDTPRSSGLAGAGGVDCALAPSPMVCVLIGAAIYPVSASRATGSDVE
jgi:hypothetical protein